MINNIISKIELLRRQWPYIPRTLRIIHRASGGWIFAWLALLIAQGLLPVGIVCVTRQAVDALVGVVKNNHALKGVDGIGGLLMEGGILPLLALLGLLLIGEQILRSAGQWVRTIQGERIQDHVTGLIHDQALAADLSFYDSPAYYDRLHRARMDARNRPLALLEGMGSLGQNALTLAGMTVLLVTYSFWIPLLLLCGTVPALWVALRYAVRFNEWRLLNTVNERRCHYYDWLLTMREAAMEMRLFALGGHYRNVYQTLRSRLRGEKIALETGQLAGELGAGATAIAATAAAMGWMILQLLSGRATVGDVVLFYQAFTQGQRLLATLLRNTGEIYRNVLFLENLFELLKITPHIKDPLTPHSLPPINKEIACEDLFFRYPDSERMILNGFSLTLPAGKITALAGENGEGKTTLIKLLCRFYEPEKGRITIDGCDLRDLHQDEWRRQITVLFQEPMRYHASVSQNIAHGNLQSEPGPEEIEAAAGAAGAHELIARLPEGYETVLGRLFGGVELSSGEWQRVASARAFLRRARLIILDEPTSMLDAWAEGQWFKNFRSLAAGCTVLIISHRLTTIMHADMINVMRGGRILESGTHDALLKQGGRYYEAWEAQRNRNHS